MAATGQHSGRTGGILSSRSAQARGNGLHANDMAVVGSAGAGGGEEMKTATAQRGTGSPWRPIRVGGGAADLNA